MAEADKSPKETNIHSIKSIYILKIIIQNIQKIKLLNIIRYNKSIKEKLNLDINDYKNEYSKIKIEIELFQHKMTDSDCYIFNEKSSQKLGEDLPIIGDDFNSGESEKKKLITYDFIRRKSQFESFYHINFDDDLTEIKDDYIKENDKVSKIKIIIDYEVDSLDTLFYDCSIIKKINFIHFTRNNIKTISHMFKYCRDLVEINFNKCIVENVIDMKEMFYGCESLLELDLSFINTTNVTNMSNMFRNCRSLKKLNISNFNTKNVTDLSFMFE